MMNFYFLWYWPVMIAITYDEESKYNKRDLPICKEKKPNNAIMLSISTTFIYRC